MRNIQLNVAEVEMLHYILKSVNLNLALGCFDFKPLQKPTYKEDFKNLLFKVKEVHMSTKEK